MSTPSRFHAIAAASLWVLFAAASAPADPPTTAPEQAQTPAAVPAPRPAPPPALHPAEPRLNKPGGDAEGAIGLYARGDYEAVVKLLDLEFRAGRASIQQRLLLARAMLHLGRDADGLAVLRDVLKTDSENPEANGLAGRVLFGQGKHKEAADYLEHAWKLKKDPFTASTLGQCYYALGEIAKAKEYLTTALAEDIRNPDNSFVLGKICLARGAGADAEKYLLMAQDAGLDSVELHHLLGQAYLLQRKYVGPIMVKRLPGQHKPGDIVDEHVVLAKQEGGTEQYQVCTRFCALYEGQAILGHMPNRVPIVDGRSRPLSQVELQSFADAQFMLAVGWFAAGQYESSSEFLGKSNVLRPDWKPALDLRAQLAIAMKDFAGLDKTLAAAAEKKVFDAATVADFYYKAAVVLRAEGKRAEALAMLKKADAAVPTSANVLRALARLSEATGDLPAARGYYARIVELFPDATDIDELRNILKNLTEKTGGGHATTMPDEDE